QRRVITVREAARAQGYPDRYIFMPTPENSLKDVDHYVRQIGNAVPIPLGLALGKCVGKMLLQNWVQASE
ncbi:hypothetical protein PUNSTDRAFT_71697, partial [Punctularia strigosozonata HHB-11173 SS5]|uniref:uncharacterized protein n=1 Tax=Punctularia strigosozonata (strain HHB-11173) TaxID=741275 RepID=UPI000441821D